MKKWVKIVVFIFVFCGAFLLLSSQWIKDNFETNDFGIILFHLRMPMLGNGVPMIGSFVFEVIILSFAIAFCVAFYGVIIKGVKLVYIKLSSIKSLYKSISLMAFAIALFALCVNVVINRFHIKDYLKAQTTFSQLYESYYKPYNVSQITQKPTQNLIVIIVESLESNFHNYTAEMGGGKIT